MSELSAMNRKKIQSLADKLSKHVNHCTPGLISVSIDERQEIKDPPEVQEVVELCIESTDPQMLSVSKTEIECLICDFNVLLREQINPGKANGLDRQNFRSILHNKFGMSDAIIMDAVFRTFDTDVDSFISVKEWIEGLSVFLRGTLDEKIKFCFQVYDSNGDNYITKEEMFHMLRNSLIQLPNDEDPEEGVKDMVEITLKRMDYDHDGKVSLADFDKAVREENLLLEAFGTCLPDRKSIRGFEQQVFQHQLEK